MTDSDAVKLHNVHLFYVVRVLVPGIPAATHADAVTAANSRAWDEMHELLDERNMRFINHEITSHVEFGEELSHALVDEQGDKECINSTWHAADGGPMK